MLPPLPRLACVLTSFIFCSLASLELGAAEERPPRPAVQQYAPVAAVLAKYCAGCHNPSEPEGKLAVTSHQAVMAGGSGGPIVLAGKPDESRLLGVLTGREETQLPPEGEPRPTAAEIELLRQWIASGAGGANEAEAASPAPLHLAAPALPAAPVAHHFVSAACRVDQDIYAVGQLGTVELREGSSDKPRWVFRELAGKVNCLRISRDQQRLVVAGGIAGVGGEAVVINVADGSCQQRFHGHADSIYCAALSPDGQTLATGSYDRSVVLWELASGRVLHTLTGHNGAIYDLDFDPSGQVLATASADQTVKLWHVASGQRLDTLGQPEGEQRCVRFSPDGQTLVAAGADKQIRQWRLVAHDRPAINPLLVARFAHEADIVQLAFDTTGKLFSASIDLTIKAWDARQITGLGTVAELSDVPVGLCLATSTGQASFAVQLDGRQVAWTTPAPAENSRSSPPAAPSPFVASLPSEPRVDKPAGQPAGSGSATVPSRDTTPPATTTELEPNDRLEQAHDISLPQICQGVIDAPHEATADQDLWKFHAQAGQTWIMEVAAASQGSPLDSRLDVLDADGHPVLRTRLQATRESYFTFRGKDSSTSDDFRLHKWEDMELDEYLYANGEIVRLWLYPRGPDSGFKVYPGGGKRHTFFDTTPLAHALGEPTYIVRELAAGEAPIPNGLPVFPIYYENDDDPQTRLGKDSRLTFVAPASGDYLLRVRDARGFGGPEFRYQVSLRSPQPDFQLKVAGTQMAMPPGSGREWSVEVTRIDGLQAPIAIELMGLPEGVVATNPLIVEAGQQAAVGSIYLEPSAAGIPSEFEIQLVATAQAGEQSIRRPLAEQLQVRVTDKPEVQLRLVAARDPSLALEELVIHPGQTISARVIADRHGADSRIELGKEDSGRNLPHGAFVDNIGLNGLLIPEGQTEREFFITAAPKVAAGRRQFHLKSNTAGNPTSRPIWLNVLPAGPAR